MQEKFERYKAWLIAAGSIVAVLVAGFKFMTQSESQFELVNQNIEAKAQAAEVRAVADREFFEEQISDVAEDVKELKREQEIVKSDVNGMSIATTQGAEASTRLLAGKLTAVQQTVGDIRQTQEEIVSDMDTVQVQIFLIQSDLDALPDTIFATQTRVDTFLVKDRGHWIRRVIPGF